MARDIGREIRWLLEEKHGGKLIPAARRDLERLKRGEHVSYVIGWAPFLGVQVDLGEKPLIPRPETEYWVEKIIETVPRRANLKILDVFCGSGCAGLAVLKHLSRAKADFADIEPRFFRGIRRSARQNKIDAKRFRTIRSDVFKDIKGRYDLILANPPYVPSGRKLPRSLDQEPRQALFGGKDGLRYIRKLLKQAPSHLKPGGKLVIEFDSVQRTAIHAMAEKLGYETEFHKDQYGKWRYASLASSIAT